MQFLFLTSYKYIRLGVGYIMVLGIKKFVPFMSVHNNIKIQGLIQAYAVHYAGYLF